MSPEKQRIAIAEECGWRPYNNRRGWPPGSPCKCGNKTKVMPSYHTDLNALREAENSLDMTGQDFYLDWLIKITGDQYPIFATAAQRTEAFLRTIGKWKP